MLASIKIGGFYQSFHNLNLPFRDSEKFLLVFKAVLRCLPLKFKLEGAIFSVCSVLSVRSFVSLWPWPKAPTAELYEAALDRKGVLISCWVVFFVLEFEAVVVKTWFVTFPSFGVEMGLIFVALSWLYASCECRL